MAAKLEPSAQHPRHVPDSLVVDFDAYAPSLDALDFFETCVAFQEETESPVIWSPHHGGHWVPTRGQDVFDIYADHERFSSKYYSIPRVEGQGRLGAFTMDPPEHKPFRTFLNKGMTPKIVAEKKAFVRQLAVELIEGFLEKGRCEFITEFADILPLTVFLDLVELPLEGRENLADWVDKTTRERDPTKGAEALLKIAQYLEPFLEERRQNPGADMLSAAATAKVNGCPISNADAVGAAVHIMMAGLDTVSSMLGFLMIFLAQNAKHRQDLVNDPELISRAVNELARRFATVTMVRQVRMDIDYLGVTMKKDDMVALPSAFYNLDPTIYKKPLSVDWSRRVKQILTYGNGVHRCPGAALGNAELTIVLEEWLKRIPDFSLAPGHELPVVGGTVAKILNLPLQWAP